LRSASFLLTSASLPVCLLIDLFIYSSQKNIFIYLRERCYFPFSKSSKYASCCVTIIENALPAIRYNQTELIVQNIQRQSRGLLVL
jgi:hypothetical protein